ncbi:MAG TPA: TerB family tellurite resistance protein [Thermoanaerobaculia bacterium]
MGFKALAKLFQQQTPEEREREKEHRLRLATASVLLETAWADESFSIAEKNDIVGYLRQRFRLDENDARELLEAADEHRADTIDHFAMTNFLRQNLPLAERIDIVKEMWRLVHSDGNLHQYENYLVRKLADLLGLEHHVMIEAKLAVARENR